MPILRPMLQEPFSEIDAYVRAHGLAWVTDESNDDTHFPRNFIRHQVLPVLEGRFPGVTKAMARSASHMAEAQKLLDDLAALDLAGLQREGGLAIAPLRELADGRAKNVLRFYFSKFGLDLPQSVHLEEVIRQIKAVCSDAKLEFNLGRMVGRCHKGVLILEPPTRVPGAPAEYRWHGEAVWNLPELGGVLTFLPASGVGVSASKLESAPVTVRLRRGGERMQLEASRPKRTLKNLLQEAGVPFWRRQRLPLVYLGDELAFVPGVGLARACRASPREPSVLLEWTESVFTG
jgi:tRNA(Ile)-lysidine synthase